MTKQRIKQWSDYWDGQIYGAYSGGKDSGVLRDIIRSMAGVLHEEVPMLFSNTGMEYPEIVAFVKQQQKEFGDIIITRPKTTFRKVIEEHGFPLVSKKVAMMVRRVRTQPPESSTTTLYKTGYNSKGGFSNNSKIPQKWMKLIDAPFGTQEKCCDYLKKEPFRRYEKETKRKPIIGIMAAEGGARATLTTCNVFEGSNQMSRPMLFWTQKDVWEYTRKYNIPYASCYDDYVLDNGDTVAGEVRTGCMFCAFGAHLEKSPNRFQRMELTHPKQWNYFINKLKMNEALDFIGVPYKNGDEDGSKKEEDIES